MFAMPRLARKRRRKEEKHDSGPDEGMPAGHKPVITPRIIGLATIFILLVAILVIAAAHAARPVANGNSAGYAPAPRPPKGAEVVYVGFEPIQVDSISLDSDTFETSFYIWWRWRGPIDPCPTTDVLNSTASSSNYVIEYSYTNAAGRETPTALPGGYKYQTAKISAGVSDPFSIGRYPIDNQLLRIRIENNTYDFNQLVYVPDTANMSHNPPFEVAGWDLTGTSVGDYVHEYGTDFGYPIASQASKFYSQLTYDIEVSRPFSHFLMKLFLPMFVVLLAGLSALFVKADDFDVRLAMAGTGLLTLIFLQQGYAGDLPSTSPVVLMDEIYALAYLAVGVTFLRVVFTTTRLHHSHQTAASFVTVDRMLAAGMAFAFLIGATLLIAF
jgi:hypothetical protein